MKDGVYVRPWVGWVEDFMVGAAPSLYTWSITQVALLKPDPCMYERSGLGGAHHMTTGTAAGRVACPSSAINRLRETSGA